MQVNLISTNLAKMPVSSSQRIPQYRQSAPIFRGSDGEEIKSSFFSPLTKPFKKGYEWLTDKMALFIGKEILSTDTMAKIIKKTEKSKMVAHISCATSLIISGLYMHQTLKNKKLDNKKKVTLAINQGSVAVLSAFMGYTIDSYINKAIDKYRIPEKFIAANASNPKIGKYVDGIRCAIPLIVFGTVYRFLTPVLVTPIANWLGDKVTKKTPIEGKKA